MILGLGKESFIKRLDYTFLRETARVTNVSSWWNLKVVIGNLATYLIK